MTQKRWKTGLFSKIMLGLAVILIGLLNHFTSPVGIDATWFKPLYYIPIMVAAIQYGFWGGIITAVATSFAYAPHELMFLGMPEFHWVGKISELIGFFAIATITGSFVDKKKFIYQKLLEQYLMANFQNNYSQSIIQSINSGVIAVNKEMLVTAINNGAREILAISGDLEGVSIRELFPGSPELIKLLESQLDKNNRIKVRELVQLSLDGRPKTLEFNLFPLIYDQVNRGHVLIFNDVTELKNLREHMIRNDKLAALGELSAGIAHEIRNPLGIIKAIEETMQRELDDRPEAIQQLEMIDEEVERANRVVNRLMDTARPQSGVKKEISINEVAEETLSLMDNYLVNRSVSTEFKPGLVKKIFADAEQIKQVIVNLIFNSIQAMPDGGSIVISTEMSDSNRVKMIISDTGKGIEPDILPKVFDPFFTTRSDGTGLGLSIVHRIVDEHGGLISLTTEHGKGTRVEITLPTIKGGMNI